MSDGLLDRHRRDPTAECCLAANPTKGLTMRRIFILAVIVATAMTATAARAASPHFKHGGTPVCTISGSGTNSTSTTCTGSLTGLGGGDVTINVTVSGFAVYQCQNGGGTTA